MTPRRRVHAAAAALVVAWGVALGAADYAAEYADHAEYMDGSRENSAYSAAAPEHLADTGLYLPAQFGTIDPRNRAYAPQYPLWSDGAVKARWVYLPDGAAIDTSDPGDWAFPVGTRFWKQFTFNGRHVETRFLWRASAARWVFATYVWNEEQTDAVLAPADGVPGVAEVAPGRRHDVPGETECRACHGAARPAPLGFNALQLSTDRDPNAIHGEPLAPGMITLATLDAERRFSPARPEWIANPPRIKTSHPRTRAVLGYLAANCGACHNRSGEIGAAVPSLRHADIADGDEVAATLLHRTTSWQVPGQPDGATVLIDPVSPDISAMLVRMRSRRPSSQMPPLGTKLRDDAALDAIARWIATDLGSR